MMTDPIVTPSRRGLFGWLFAAPLAAEVAVKAVLAPVAAEPMVEVSGFGLAALKTEGMEVAYDAAFHDAVVYGIGYIVTHEHVVDDLYTRVRVPMWVSHGQ